MKKVSDSSVMAHSRHKEIFVKRMNEDICKLTVYLENVISSANNFISDCTVSPLL